MCVGIFDALGNGFAVGYLWLADISFDSISPLEDVCLDVKWSSPIPLIIVSPESSSVSTRKGVFLDHLPMAVDSFSAFALSLVAIAIEMTESEIPWAQGSRLIGIAKRVSGLRVLHSEQCDDVARLGGRHLFT